MHLSKPLERMDGTDFDENCGACAKFGKRSKLMVYQINFDEAVKICENDQCTYPVCQDSTSTNIILSRKLSNISDAQKRKPTLQKPTTTAKGTPLASKISTETKRNPSTPVYPVNKLVSFLSKRQAAPYRPGITSKSHTSPEKTAQVKHPLSPSKPADGAVFFPQWQNMEALCWLDVVMCLFVHSVQIQKSVSQIGSISSPEKSALLTLITAYKQAVELINRSHKKNAETSSSKPVHTMKDEMTSNTDDTSKSGMPADIVKMFQNVAIKNNGIKTGAGFKLSSELNASMFNVNSEYIQAFSLLQDVRETLFLKLQPKLQCVKGKNDSPLFTVPLLVKEHPEIEKLMLMKYRFDFECLACGYHQTDQYKQVLPTFPHTEPYFSMNEPSFERSCFKCKAPWQKRKMIYEELSDIVMLHFVEGLKTNDIDSLSFIFSGIRYCVRGLIQYRSDPDHFVTWIYDRKYSAWMECDDLKSPICQFKKCSFSVPASQIHIVMWERCDETFLKPIDCSPRKGKHRKRSIKVLTDNCKAEQNIVSVEMDAKISSPFHSKEAKTESSGETESHSQQISSPNTVDCHINPDDYNGNANVNEQHPALDSTPTFQHLSVGQLVHIPNIDVQTLSLLNSSIQLVADSKTRQNNYLSVPLETSTEKKIISTTVIKDLSSVPKYKNIAEVSKISSSNNERGRRMMDGASYFRTLIQKQKKNSLVLQAEKRGGVRNEKPPQARNKELSSVENRLVKRSSISSDAKCSATYTQKKFQSYQSKNPCLPPTSKQNQQSYLPVEVNLDVQKKRKVAKDEKDTGHKKSKITQPRERVPSIGSSSQESKLNECSELENLYSALNLPFSEDHLNDSDLIPDVSELVEFMDDNGNDQNCFENFLAL